MTHPESQVREDMYEPQSLYRLRRLPLKVVYDREVLEQFELETGHPHARIWEVAEELSLVLPSV